MTILAEKENLYLNTISKVEGILPGGHLLIKEKDLSYGLHICHYDESKDSGYAIAEMQMDQDGFWCIRSIGDRMRDLPDDQWIEFGQLVQQGYQLLSDGD